MSKKLTRRNFLIGSSALLASTGMNCTFAQSAKPFKIGCLTSLTGVGGPYGGPMLEAIKLAVAEVNRAGGAAGRMFQLTAEDDQTVPDAAVLAAKKLVEVAKVDAVLGIWTSSVALSTLPIFNDAGIISMNTGGAPELLTANRKGLAWMFQASNIVFGAAFAKIARDQGMKRPAVMAFNNSSYVGLAANFKKYWERGGGQVTSTVVYEPNQSSYRTELNRALASNPDVIAFASYRPDATIILKEWYETGQPCKFIMPGWTANGDLVKALGKDATEGLISVSNVPASSSSAYRNFVETFKKSTGKDPDMFATQAYDMVIALALAIEASGPTADISVINGNVRRVTNGPGEKVSSFIDGRKLLRMGKGIDYDGASSALKFGAHGETVPDFGVYQIHEGKLQIMSTINGESLVA